MQVGTQQRLAAGYAHLLQPERPTGDYHLLNILERQVGASREEGVILAEALAGHAVPASEIAPVSD